MSIRVRGNGGRRRASGDTLVRSIPAVVHAPPPILLQGAIFRAMRATLIEDYADLATANWSTGVSGNITQATGIPAPNTSYNCYYHHHTTPNMRTTGVEHVMQPIRWVIDVPASNGGSYDFWDSLPEDRVRAFNQVPDLTNTFGALGVSTALLPDGSHAIWHDGLAKVALRGGVSGYSGLHTCFQYRADLFANFAQSSLQSIAPTYQIWNVGFGSLGGYETPNIIRAMQHRVNGLPVGDLIENPDDEPDAWNVAMELGDTYEIDVWYSIRSPAKEYLPASPGKACAVIPLSMVHNGSRRVSHPRDGVTIIYPHNFMFTNVDFSPKFNFEEQTYSVTVSGHSGWTLKDGSNGPHRMVTGDGWTATRSNGSLTWRKDTNDGPVSKIVLRWDREVAHAEFFGGSTLSEDASEYGFAYRINDGNPHYRTSTESANFGSIDHSPCGLFNQAGTSTFTLVPWNKSTSGFGEGHVSGAGYSTFSELPTTMTFTRRND